MLYYVGNRKQMIKTLIENLGVVEGEPFRVINSDWETMMITLDEGIMEWRPNTNDFRVCNDEKIISKLFTNTKAIILPIKFVPTEGENYFYNVKDTTHSRIYRSDEIDLYNKQANNLFKTEESAALAVKSFNKLEKLMAVQPPKEDNENKNQKAPIEPNWN